MVFGATTAGEFIDGEIEEGSIVMMLLDMNPAYFKLEFIETSLDKTFEDSKKLGITGKEIFLLIQNLKKGHHFTWTIFLKIMGLQK